jgi:hypothetical protein
VDSTASVVGDFASHFQIVGLVDIAADNMVENFAFGVLGWVHMDAVDTGAAAHRRKKGMNSLWGGT